jgi:hypothetical protein
MAEIKSDLQRAYEALAVKRVAYDRLWNYYLGEQPVVYTAERLRKIFQNVNARFVQNWCAVVVDSLWERVQLKGFTAEDEGLRARLSELWRQVPLGLEADDAHLGAFVCGEAYLVAWRDEEGASELYFNDGRMCHLFYDPERPRVKRFGAKWWDDEFTEKRRLTLYYPERLEYYVSRGSWPEVNDWRSFEPDGDSENPWGEVPVFHLRTARWPASELANAVPLQNGVNKLLIDMMVAAEYGAFKQRYIISNAESLGRLRNAPNEVWDLPAGDNLGQGTEVGEFGATPLQNYFDAIDRLAISIAIITQTPKNFFFATGNEISGEALLAMEAPLNAKARARIERFGPVWREVAAFLLRMEGRAVMPPEIEPVFEQPQTMQPLTRAQARNFDVSSGMPLRTVLRREGWTPGELEEMEGDVAAAQEAENDLGAAILRAFERGEGG